jgi:hypothetical protein
MDPRIVHRQKRGARKTQYLLRPVAIREDRAVLRAFTGSPG